MLLAKRTQDFFPTLFNDLFENFNYGMPAATSPQMNIIESEEEFDCEIPDEEAEKITTVQQAIDYVTANLDK